MVLLRLALRELEAVLFERSCGSKKANNKFSSKCSPVTPSAFRSPEQMSPMQQGVPQMLFGRLCSGTGRASL